MMYQPKTGAACYCRRGVERDNCPRCEGTGMEIDFRAIHAARRERERAIAAACPRCQKARAEIISRGLTPSSVADHGEERCGLASIELAGPGTFGAAMHYAQVLSPGAPAGGAK